MTYIPYVHVGARTCVQLRGLSTVELNGTEGHVESYDQESGRVVVDMSGAASGRKRVKASNLVVAMSETAFGVSDARWALRISDDAAVCREHAAEACGICCADYGLLNLLRKKEIDGFNQRRAQTVCQAYFARPVAEQNQSPGGSRERHMPGIMQLMDSMSISNRAEPDNMLVVLGGLTYMARGRPGQGVVERLDAFYKVCLEQMQAYDQDVRNRVQLFDEEALAEEQAAKIAREKKDRKKGKKTKSSRGPVPSEIDMGQHVDIMMRIFIKAGVRDMGNFFAEFQEFTSSIEALQDALKGAATGRGEDENIDIDPKLAEAMARYKGATKFQTKHGNVQAGDPGEWTPSRVSEFLVENGVDPRPSPSSSVMLQVAREMIEFQKKMLWMISNIPDDEEAQRLGRRELYGEEIDSDEDLSIIVQSPLPDKFDPTSLDAWQGDFASAVLAGVTGDGPGASPSGSVDAASELTKILRTLAQELDGNREALYMLQDPDQTTSVVLRLLEARKRGPGEPCLVFMSLVCRRIEMIGERFTALTEMMKEASVEGGGGVVNLEASEGAVELLRSVLRTNRRKIKKSVRNAKEKHWPKFAKYSVLVATPEMGADRCPICGTLATKMCGGCRRVSYCSAEHQHAHWKVHKKQCSPK